MTARLFSFACLASCLFAGMLLLPSITQAADKSRVPPVSIYQAMLNVNKETGWIQFRNYDKRQIVYFSALQTLHCRLKEIRYSANSLALDQRFALVPCNPLNPFALPSDAPIGATLVEYPYGTVEHMAVQIVWEDGTESDVMVYEPCPDVGEQTCAYPVKAAEVDSKSSRALSPEAEAEGAEGPQNAPDADGDVERGIEPRGLPSSN